MNGPNADKALKRIIARAKGDPEEAHEKADALMLKLIKEHVPDSLRFRKAYNEMLKWYA